ncbi:MAG: DNA internalization-related competence protein ComEC/Rec2 [Clostridia bacterium]|nr:DNA internalization-related competence protein ComEC/Rec2 [Clostridia bacterium]
MFISSLVFLAFSAWYLYRDIRPPALQTDKYEVSGTICADTIVQPADHRTIITLNNVAANGNKIKNKVRLYVYSTHLDYEYGDELCIASAKLSVPDGVTNPNGFDFNAYLWRSGVALTGSASYDDITLVNKHASLERTLLRLRKALAEKSDDIFGDASDVMRAVLLGDRSALSDETYEDFSRVGISHLIALSGLHVSAIAFMLDWLLKKLKLPRNARYIFIIVILCMYVLMTGKSNSTIRAVIMYALLCVITMLGYPADTLTRLSCAFLLQLGINPLLISDNGFVLSYASVAALLCFSELFRTVRRQNGLASIWGTIRQSAEASFEVQLFTYPLLSAMFYSVPLFSVPVNMLCIPFAMLVLYLGIVVLLCGCVSASLASVLAYPVKLIWQGIKLVCAQVADLRISSLPGSPWPLLLLIGFYLLAVLSSVYIAPHKTRRAVGILTMVLIILAHLLWPASRIDHLRLTYLDVGYGDGAIADAKGSVYVIDCGRSNGIVADYLSSEKRYVSGIFVSHPDSDHAGGLKEILKRYPRAAVYVPATWDCMDVPAEMAALLSNADVRYLVRDDVIELAEDIYAEVTWPPEGFVPHDDNSGSLVFRLVYEDKSALFTGDITDSHDAAAADDSDILKVAHHGSKYATTAEMLSLVTPELSVISVSGNSYGHPTQDVLDRLEKAGSRVYRTDECGAIIIDILQDGSVIVTPYLNTVGG